MTEIKELECDIAKLEDELRRKKTRFEQLKDIEESKKLPEYSRHECIDCHKHRAWRGVYHDGKLDGYICDSCDYEIL